MSLFGTIESISVCIFYPFLKAAVRSFRTHLVHTLDTITPSFYRIANVVEFQKNPRLTEQPAIVENSKLNGWRIAHVIPIQPRVHRPLPHEPKYRIQPRRRHPGKLRKFTRSRHEPIDLKRS